MGVANREVKMRKLTGVICPESPHFTWEEVFKSSTAKSKGIDNTAISESDINNVINTAKMIEKVRGIFNKDGKDPHSIIVSSWYRCEALNTAVGGTKTSHHRLGMAVDFHIVRKATGERLKVKEVCRKIMESDIPFTQLIDEYGNWTHISFQPSNYKKQVLTFRYGATGKTLKYDGLI